MKSLAFIVPVHGRLALASICLRQLRRTCDQLCDAGVLASAIIVSDRASLDELDPLSLGFGTVTRDNDFTSRRFNDGIQLATDPALNPRPVDYVVPCGSDDWVDHRLFLEPLPAAHEIQGFPNVCFVSEDGTRMFAGRLRYEGGAGVRIIPRELVEALGFRPGDEDRKRSCDTSMLRNLQRSHGDRLAIDLKDSPPEWIVDWKTKGEQINSFSDMTSIHGEIGSGDPFDRLAGHWPDEALEEMREYYGLVPA